MHNKMQLTPKDFQQQLSRYIPFRGIDIVLYLEDGSILELDKNRQLEGDLILKKNRDSIEKSIPISEVVRAEFYAA